MTWTEGRSDSDYIATDCGWMRHDQGAEQYRATCRYLRLSLQPLNFSNFGSRDVWVTKVGYNGSLLWARQLGSAGDEVLGGFAINRTDHSIYVAGSTSGNMLRTSHAIQDPGLETADSGGTDCWILRISQYGEYIKAFQFGSNTDDFVAGVVVASDGVYVGAVFPDQALGIIAAGGQDAVIVKFTNDLVFMWAGVIGSEGNEILAGIHLYTGDATDGRERILCFGQTDFHLYLANKFVGTPDIFLTIFSIGPTANFERGTQVGSGGIDVATGAASAPDGSIYLAGYSDGNLFFDWDPFGEIADPKPGAFDGFVMKFNEKLEWQWTAMPGTEKDEYVHGIVFLPGFTEQKSDLLLTGTTRTFWPEAESINDVVTPDGSVPTELGHVDAWLMTLSATDGSFAGWQKQLRSTGDQQLLGLAAEAAGGHVYLVGSTTDGFTPELGQTALVAYGADDALLLKLVWGRAAARCFRGSACEASISSGIGLQDDQGLLSVTRCGSGTRNALGVPNGTTDGFAVDDGAGDTSGLRQRLKWGNPQEGRILEAIVGRYVLCWCASGCDGAVPLEISVVFISGPNRNQTRTCVRGQSCDVTGIEGRDLDSWDRVAAMDSCAVNFAVGFPQGGFTQGIVTFKSQNADDLSCATVTPDEIEGVSSNFGCGRVTASAGDYKLCFCTPRGAGAQCEQSFDFGFEIGVLTLEGPFTGQLRKCTQNQRCAVDTIQGIGLKDGDLLLILDECRMPQTGQASGDMTIRGVAGLTPELPVAASGGGQFFVIAHPTTAALGTYRMCWCRQGDSGGCTQTDDFATDVGPLSIVAPAANHYRRCVRGQICSIIDLEGWGLADGDVVHILKYCPNAPSYNIFDVDTIPPDVYVDGWPRNGLSVPAELGGRSVSWGDEPVMNAVGIYQLCWCMGSAGHRCTLPQDFFVPIGELEVAGPLPDQSFTAVAGHPITLPQVSAYGMGPDLIAIVPFAANCTGAWENILVAAQTTGFPSEGILAMSVLPFHDSTGTGTVTDFEVSNFTAGVVSRGGGTFALCMLKSGSKKAFANRGYEFLGCGNEDEARAACNPAPLPMPKSLESQLNLEAAVAMARKEGVQIHPCGMGVWLGARWYGSSSAGRWLWDDGSMLLNGSFDTVEASVGVYTNWAPGQPSAIGDHETEPLLYLSYPSGRWHDARLQKHQFAVVCQETVAQGTGSLRLQGPFGNQTFTASAGEQLQISPLEGLDLAVGDMLLATWPNEPCGIARAAPLGGEGISYPSPDGMSFNFSGTATAPGGPYQLCWCRRAINITDCRQAEDFVVKAADLQLLGP
ncbi:Uncharacterized protein SCF082_LOCUS42528 [Durusdinium trenchii]|uniref:C-type lectin domain-containing protein n=1 Tax=Durusdinium trenchii TaxID=1381693 RepID=A0ABP0QPE9_9DINO